MIEVTWDEGDNTIMRAQMIGNWTWEDYVVASDKMLELARTVTYRVDLITDLLQSGPVPRGSASVHILRSREQKPSNFGVTVLVGADIFLKSLLQVFDQVYKKRVPASLLVNTVEEAHAVIARIRAEDEAQNPAASTH